VELIAHSFSSFFRNFIPGFISLYGIVSRQTA
jgi:hypothetical protein